MVHLFRKSLLLLVLSMGTVIASCGGSDDDAYGSYAETSNQCIAPSGATLAKIKSYQEMLLSNEVSSADLVFSYQELQNKFQDALQLLGPTNPYVKDKYVQADDETALTWMNACLEDWDIGKWWDFNQQQCQPPSYAPLPYRYQEQFVIAGSKRLFQGSSVLFRWQTNQRRLQIN